MNSIDSLRLFISIGGLALFWGWAQLFPYRQSEQLKHPRRLLTNLTLNGINALLITVLIPISLVELSHTQWLHHEWVQQLSQGLWPLEFLLSYLILDFVIYWQHRLFHRIPFLWKLHRLHHSDVEIDTTTAGRFHGLEILLSYIIKASTIVLFNLQAEAVLAFEILLNASALFNHSNFHLPHFLEKPCRLIIITPQLHRIHHSTLHQEMNSNFGFSISLWDQIFKSLSLESKESPKTMMIGMTQFRNPQDQGFFSLLKQPWCKEILNDQKEETQSHT